MDNAILKSAAMRLVDIRSDIVIKQPFFGRLLMRMSFGFEDCGTAYTDMRKIVFDPSFTDSLSDTELRFILLHEVMHCVLKHCTRGSGKLPYMYNVACDIVVNSIILETMGISEIEIGGNRAMHLAPNGREGREFSAEEVYNMLFQKTCDEIDELLKDCFDNHDIWKNIFADDVMEVIWNGYIDKAAKGVDKGSGIPESIERIIMDTEAVPKISWKQILHDFIQKDGFDYSFTVPDKRYSENIIMPSYYENDEIRVDKIWFVVDTSGSVSTQALTEAMNGIKDAVNQINHLSGYISFFDCEVTEPKPFESVDDVSKIKPIGCGGTDFHIIFEKLDAYFDENPTAIIIITDGYADFPDESASRGIPIFWIIVDSDVEPPWGECVHISSI